MATDEERRSPFGSSLAVTTTPTLVRLVAQVQQEYVVSYGGVDEAAVGSSEFVPPLGRFVLGVLFADQVAMGGWRHIGGGAEHSVEIRRMYVVPALRACVLSRRMLAELERSAADAGAPRVVLITGDRTVARGATLRRHIVTVSARLAMPQRRRMLHLPAHWPWATQWTALWNSVFATGPPAPA
jgi:GNAT superfamily N-acetyltransferase